jgi:OmcA/MtrC family decaheme c-type cytochrome
MMSNGWLKTGSTMLFAGVLALTGCGKDGAQGPQGPQGPAGTDGTKGTDGTTGVDFAQVAKLESCVGCHPTAGVDHQTRYNAFADGIDPATTKFAVSNVSDVVVTDSATAGKKKATITFTLTKGGQPFTGTPASLAQKTVYFVTYDATAKKFPTPAYKQAADVDPDGSIGGQDSGSVVNFSFGSMTAVAGQPGVFTMVKDGLSSDPVAGATDAFVYGYFGDALVPTLEGNLNPGGRHYALMDNMVSFSKQVAGTVGYTSTATVSGCERCHGANYSKHGYRQAKVAGLPDFVACKACHTDFRRGTDAGWYVLQDDPAFAASGAALDVPMKKKYAYTANVMQDTHNSHAFEFAYPQSMANCTTCHAGHEAEVTANAFFKLSTCKSCHPVTNSTRAPALKSILSANATLNSYHSWIDLYDQANESICLSCHGNLPNAPTFDKIHSGFDAQVYSAPGVKYSGAITATVTGATFTAATKKVTVNFSVSGAPADATVKPTVVMSLYGYGTKDFVVSGHGSQPDKKRNLEWSSGSTSNSPRLDVVPGTAAGTWVATADLTTWAGKLSDGSVKRAEIGILPAVTLANGTVVAAKGVTQTLNVAKDSSAAGIPAAADIVSADKCNKCHEALGTTFHSPSYGSAGVVGCRLCHTVNDGGSHLEMQGRSIDSYVHAIHSFQPFDVKNINFADPVAAMEYEEHINSVYPNFSIQNCESCHNAGTYQVPDQSKSLPGVLSASATLTGTTRSINGIPAVVVGPAQRACGSCHRTQLINEDQAGGLSALNAHMASFGTQVTNGTGVLDGITAAIMSMFK